MNKYTVIVTGLAQVEAEIQVEADTMGEALKKAGMPDVIDSAEWQYIETQGDLSYWVMPG